MIPETRDFPANVRVALGDSTLQGALAKARGGFVDKRRAAIDALPEYGALCDRARVIRDHVLANLGPYLESFEQKVVEHNGTVHWARDGTQACRQIVQICRDASAKRIIKGKTMVGEEIALNEALETAGLTVIETDLGEYIIQLAKEPPSHIIAPAVHKTREQISELFRHHHTDSQARRDSAPEELLDEARRVMRGHFINADVGITGANFLIAETGSSLIVTNEGNGDLSSSLPSVHIVVAGIEKIVPNLEDATTLLRVLGRSATGQHMTTYTTLSTGCKRPRDADGPDEYHVVLVDNGRSEMLGNEFRDMLRCIRCGACLNHCPVYTAIGGHAYGWVYPGPMGSVLTPYLVGLEQAHDLPNASSLCGRCEQVCPVQIPLPQLLREHRARAHRSGLGTRRSRWALAVWAMLATRPWLYHCLTAIAIAALRTLARGRGSLSRLPLAGAWTAARDFPVPQGKTFMQLWRRRR